MRIVGLMRVRNEGRWLERCYHIGLQSSNIGSKPEPRAAVDVLPNPIPDYGRQTVVLKQ